MRYFKTITMVVLFGLCCLSCGKEKGTTTSSKGTSASALLGKYEQGKVFIVSGPAGTGKTTLVRMLTKEFPNVVMNISYTTRQKRKGEKEGVDYFFISEKEFLKREQQGEFLESVPALKSVNLHGCPITSHEKFDINTFIESQPSDVIVLALVGNLKSLEATAMATASTKTELRGSKGDKNAQRMIATARYFDQIASCVYAHKSLFQTQPMPLCTALKLACQASKPRQRLSPINVCWLSAA